MLSRCSTFNHLSSVRTCVQLNQLNFHYGAISYQREQGLFPQITSRSSSSSSTQPAASTSTTPRPPPSGDAAKPLPFSSMPGPKGLAQLPYIGALTLFKPFTEHTTDTIHLAFENLFQKYGPVVRIQMQCPTVLVRDVRDVETMYRNEGLQPIRPGLQLTQQVAKRNNLKNGIIDLQGEEWARVRSPLTRRLARVDSATYYLEDQNIVADDFRNILEDAEKMTLEELSRLFFTYSGENFGVVAYNTRTGLLDPDLLNHSETVKYLESAEAIVRLMHDEVSGKSIMHGVYRNKTYRDFEAAYLTVRNHTDKLLKQAFQTLKQKQEDGSFNPEEPDLLFSLLADPNLDFEDVSTIMLALLIAGTESAARTTQIFFYNLAINPEVQEKLHKEIIGVFGPDQPVTPETLAQMQYLPYAAKESMRMNPPNPVISRIMPKDVVLGGYHVPANTQVIISSHSVEKEYFKFENADQFIPERWMRSQEEGESKIHPMAVLPFSHGPRGCIGRRFALQSMYLAVVKVLQRFKIGVKPESQGMNFNYRNVILGPESPIAFTFTKR